MSDDYRQALKRDILATEEEIKRLEAQEQEKENRELELDEDLQVRSRLSDRELISIRRKKQEDEEEREEKKSSEAISFERSFDVSASSYSFGAEASGATGMTSLGKMPELSGISLWHLRQELFARRENQYLVNKSEPGKQRWGSIYQRMFNMEQVLTAKRERSLKDLRHIEMTTASRISRINKLNLESLNGRLSDTGRKELMDLERTEVARFWIREMAIAHLPMRVQMDMRWLMPVGNGAKGVMPYTYVKRYDLLTLKQKAGVRWAYDNVLLRYESSIAGKYVPKAAKLDWFRQKTVKDAENVLDDWDEEIYSEKKFAEMVKKGSAQLDDVVEELTGYDQFTVQEEKQIKQSVAKTMKEQLALAKESEEYN